MRYHFKKPEFYSGKFGETYICDHPVYSKCTLYVIEEKGLAVIQQRHDSKTKHTWWGEIDPWLRNEIYIHDKFLDFFMERAGPCVDGLYPTVTVRQIMWALRMKPICRSRWETVFDRRNI